MLIICTSACEKYVLIYSHLSFKVSFYWFLKVFNIIKRLFLLWLLILFCVFAWRNLYCLYLYSFLRDFFLLSKLRKFLPWRYLIDSIFLVWLKFSVYISYLIQILFIWYIMLCKESNNLFSVANYILQIY